MEANMEPAPSTFRPSITRRELAGWMEKQKRDRPVVITTLDGRLVGLAYRPDLGPGG